MFGWAETNYEVSKLHPDADLLAVHHQPVAWARAGHAFRGRRAAPGAPLAEDLA